MKLFRTLSTPRLVALIAVFAALVAGSAALAVAASAGGGPTPPAKPLANAIHDALAGPAPDGITARHHLHEQALSIRRADRRHRLCAPDRRDRPPLGDERRPRTARAAVRAPATSRSFGTPTRSPSTTRRRTPSTRSRSRSIVDRYGHRRQGSAAAALRDHDAAGRALEAGERLRRAARQRRESARVHRDGLAEARRRPTRLRTARLRRRARASRSGSRSTRRAARRPALALAATNISYGAIPASDVDVAPPAGAKVVDLGSAASRHDSGGPSDTTPQVDGSPGRSGRRRLPGRRAGHARRVAAPGRPARRQGLRARRLRARARRDAHRRAKGRSRRRRQHAHGPADRRAQRADGARARDAARHRLAWQQGGRSIVLAGSLPPAAAESAARELK